MNNVATAATHAAADTPITAGNRCLGAASQPYTATPPATTAKTPENVEAVSNRRAHSAEDSPSAQNASSPHPANTDSPHRAARSSTATVGMTGETITRLRTIFWPPLSAHARPGE